MGQIMAPTTTRFKGEKNMRAPMFCSKCNDEGVEKIVYVELTDNETDALSFEVICEKGHKTTVSLQQKKFEILFDYGAMALLDGYPREAFSSLAASLERFLEFCIKVILFHNSITKSEFENIWKYVLKQSERQLGAFYFVYLLEFKKAPEKINDKYYEFRNKVIHQGYIPKHKEVIYWGNCLLKYMFTIIKLLKDRCNDSVIQTFAQPITNEKKWFLSAPTIISLSSYGEGYGNKTFEESLEDVKKYRDFYIR